jgi:uncharacterized membrane protein
VSVTTRKRLHEDPPGLVSAWYLPGGDLATALDAAKGWTTKAKVGMSFATRPRLAPLYVLTVVAIGVILGHTVNAETRSHLVMANSTNVVNLQHHRIWTLVTSAFLLDDQVEVLAMIQLLLLMAVAELLWGWRRLLEVFFLTNAVASCLVYALVREGVHHNWFDRAITMASDVGTSYGAHAVSGAIAFSLPVRPRRALVPLAFLAVVVPLIGEHTFTDVGHLLATLIGFLTGWQMRRRPLAGRLRLPALVRRDRRVAFSFETVAQARTALTTVLHLQEHHQVHLDDAAIGWSDEAYRIHVRQTRDMDLIDGALAGGSWGVVFGTLVGFPLAGLVIGAILIAVVARLHDAGLPDTAIDRAVHAAPPANAVLLLLVHPTDRTLLTTTLNDLGGTTVPAPPQQPDGGSNPG